MTIWTIIFLLIGGVAGGLLSSVASMASLASYPVLLVVGIPPVYANVTNDAALIWTSIGSTISSTKELKGHWKETWFYTIFTVIGSVLGCVLLLSFPSSVFEKAVPFFIAFSGIMIIISGKHNALNTAKQPMWLKIVYLVALLIMGVYTGYFGAAGGVIVLVLLTYITNEKFIVINAIKNVVCGFANLVALIIFMFTSRIYWLQAIPLAIGMFIGGYIGPAILRRVPEKPVRIFIAALAFIQAGYFFYTAYLR
ncbi:sulfite exporter TauE/SafE family protein [Lactobacillus acidophilus]|uniref:sulfite exporter TauE/SafE family protein n=1 Tax=Lactobacillus acidophilus TaxID=1579 RepID=UPI0021A54315|nr:sulfite exporter TauE/SafE family protein [Lactobacillus acidophilus]MCT3603277.1 sulfite exporter TauE/SafE family protein [Lactobacillus acidophilus]MCT3622814.1 sulfite exporter TauE/SafE family protein [Lactobacillus acidophilus]